MPGEAECVVSEVEVNLLYDRVADPISGISLVHAATGLVSAQRISGVGVRRGVQGCSIDED